jgi:hypothetical protein
MWIQFQFSVSRYPVFPATFVEEAVFSSSSVFGVFDKNQMGVAAWIYIWVFYSVPLVFILCAGTMLIFMVMAL